MYIITKEPRELLNLDNQSIKVEDAGLVSRPNRRTLDSPENAEARFNDIVDAMKADVKFYDCNEEIGKWKPERKKPGPKPKAKEEHKPEPKTE